MLVYQRLMCPSPFRYVSSCRDVLLELYESLMLPLPFDLNPDPESGVESVGGASQESSEEGGSMAEPLQPPTIINTRRYFNSL